MKKQTDEIYIRLGDLKEAIKKSGHKKHITLNEGSKVIEVDVDYLESKLDLFKNVFPSDNVKVGVGGELVFR